MTYGTFMRWMGSKSWLAGAVADILDPYLWRGYCEPFVGSGAVLIEIMRRGKLRAPVTIGDASPLVADVWSAVISSPGRVCAELRLIGRLDEDSYYRVRDQVNAFSPGMDPHEIAARVLALNAYGFKGLFRVNSRGGLNVPYGHYAGERPPRLDEIVAVGTALRRLGTRVVCGGYARTLSEAGEVPAFLDPPYHGTADCYTADGFSWVDRFGMVRAARSHGMPCVITDSRCKETIGLYSGLGELAETERAPGMSSGDGSGARKGLGELVVMANFPGWPRPKMPGEIRQLSGREFDAEYFAQPTR